MVRMAWRRLVAGAGALAAVAAVSVIATTSIFAYNPATDQPNTFNGGSPANATTGAATLGVLAPGSTTTVTTNYTFASYVSLLPAQVSSPTSIRYMWQQWRHDTQNEWIYFYANNTNNATAASISGAPMWSVYYYTRRHGSTQIASLGVGGAAYAGNASSAVNGLMAATVYLDSGSTTPAFLVSSVRAQTVEPCNVAVGANCTATFAVGLQWGFAQHGFGPGTVSLSQAVESFPLGPSGAQFVYYDAWEAPNGTTLQLSFTDTAPAQSTTGVTNATGTRFVGTAYPLTQTITDANGDLDIGSLLFMASSGNGQWFQIGHINQSDQANTITPAGGTTFYQSWNESRVTAPAGSPIVGNYISNGSSTSATGAGQPTTEAIAYSVTFSSLARGTWNIFGVADDFHRRSSGQVPVGSFTIS